MPTATHRIRAYGLTFEVVNARHTGSAIEADNYRALGDREWMGPGLWNADADVTPEVKPPADEREDAIAVLTHAAAMRVGELRRVARNMERVFSDGDPTAKSLYDEAARINQAIRTVAGV